MIGRFLVLREDISALRHSSRDALGLTQMFSVPAGAIPQCVFLLAGAVWLLKVAKPRNHMKRLVVSLLFLAVLGVWSQAAEPLRVFIRSGPKTHGPGQHDHPRFLEEYTKLLNERGAKATGKQGFPTAQELENTDVLVMFLAEGGTVSPEDRANLDKFLKRGGGIVTLHDAVCGTDPQWFKTVVGGAWEHKHSIWYEGEVGVYFVSADARDRFRN